MDAAPRYVKATDAGAIEQAGSALHAGGLVAVPTETVYGLAADARNGHAVSRIFAVKGRPTFDPLIVHVPSLAAAERYGDFSDPRIRALAEAFWPGPLTLVVPDLGVVHPLVRADLPSLALRVPAHPVMRALLEHAGLPLAAPSANPFGGISPTTAAHVMTHLHGRLAPMSDLVLDGGPARIGVESTIVALVDGALQILRDGGLSREAIESVVGPIDSGIRVMERPLAPGMLARHYAPGTPLRLVQRAQAAPDAHRALLVVAGAAPADADGWAHVRLLAPDGDLNHAAAGLFGAMHELDALARQHAWQGIDVIACQNVGLGRAILDRLQRAAVPEP